MEPKLKDEHGHYITNANGDELCIGFGKGTCNRIGANGRCYVTPSRVHQCSICLMNNHPACRHKPIGSEPRKDKGSSKGESKVIKKGKKKKGGQ